MLNCSTSSHIFTLGAKQLSALKVKVFPKLSFYSSFFLNAGALRLDICFQMMVLIRKVINFLLHSENMFSGIMAADYKNQVDFPLN